MGKTRIKKAAAIILSLALAGGALTGCAAKSQIDETAVVATLGDQEISLKEANFWAKYQEAIVNTTVNYYYIMLVNSGYSETEAQSYASQYGGSLEDVADQVMESLETFYVIRNHAEEYGVSISKEEQAKMAEAADAFLENNSNSIKTLMSADRDLVINILELYTIYRKMIPLMEQVNLNEEISDEEALMKTYSYVYISLEGRTDEEGNTIEYTEAEKIQQANALQSFINEYRENGESDFDAAAKEAGYSVSEHSYHPSDEEDQLKNMNDVAETLEVGNVSDVIELNTDDKLTGIAVLRLDTKNDVEAREKRKETILTERKNECYNTLLESWKKEKEFKINEDVLKQITVDDALFQKRNEE